LSEEFPAQLAGFHSGALVAGYRLEAQVGAGGMAVVFRARDERLGRLVALKILAPAMAADAAFRRRFIAESRAAAGVDDPHIIPVYEAGEAAGVLFIAMRFVRGGDLRLMLEREGPLRPGQAAGFISPVASALDAAHGAGLVHRDVKPANILVDAREGRPDHVYLSDFGVSKGAISSVSLTAAGQFLGTPDYSAPEQIRGLAVDGRTDQYALACVAYQLLTGVVPFERDQGMAVLLAHVSEPPPSLGWRRPDLPGAVDRVLAKGLAKDPDQRYGSCGDFADALRQALGVVPYNSPSIGTRQAAVPADVSPSIGTRQAAVPADVSPSIGTRQTAVPADVAAAATIDSEPVGHRTRTERGVRTRRRWPIWTTALVVLLALVIGGGFVFYQVSQEQYYVAANSSGQVVIYRGISQHIAGFSWSSPYEITGIELSQVPSNYQQTVKTANSTGSLAQVRATVENIRTAVDSCRAAYAAREDWATAVNKYEAEVAQAAKAKKPTTNIARPPVQPAPAGATCSPSAAFGIPASALAPAGSGSS
jgi:serine/threonine protein kinase